MEKRTGYDEHHYHCTDSHRADNSSVLEFFLGARNASLLNWLYFIREFVRYSVFSCLYMDVPVNRRDNHLSADLLPSCLLGRPMGILASMAR